MIKLDLVPSCIKPVLHASQYDEGRQWQCQVLTDGVPYVFQNGDTVEFSLRKGDGLVVTTNVAVTPGSSTITLVSTEQMCAVYGSNLGEFKINSNGVKVGSVNVILEVERDPTAADKASRTEIWDLPAQVDACVKQKLETVGAKLTGYDNSESGLDATNVQDALDELAQKSSVDAYTKQESDAFITDEYDATSTYAIGDMVIHENALYVCSTAITTAEAWNSAHWTLTDIATAIGTVKTAIPTKTSDLQNDSGFAQIDDTAESASKTYSSEKIEGKLQNKYEQKLTQTLKVGENILTEASVVLGANWSGSIENGLSHTSGSTEPLTFNLATTSGKAYLITFNATNVNNANALSVKIGSTPDVDIYNGNSDFNVGIVSDGGNLIITPKSNYAGTITNLKLREVADEGEAVTFVAKNVNTSDKASGISGFWNVAIGFDNFDKNENGSRNVAIGYESLHDFKSGTRNVAVGTFALHRLESGNRNIAVGADSLWYAKKATDCIAFGHDSMNGVGTDIEHNIAIGQESLSGLTTGKQNIAIGYASVAYPQSSGINDTTCVGVSSGNYANSSCTYIGTRAGYFLKGASNTCLGKQAGAQQNTTGQQNTFLGVQCGIDNTGATAQNPKTVDNSIAIGYQARATKSNQAMIGSANVTEVVFCGNKKINFNNDNTVTWETLT